MEEYEPRLDLEQPIILIDHLTEKIQTTNKIVNVQVSLFRLGVESEYGSRVCKALSG